MNQPSQGFDWPHAPIHRLGQGGAYMVTAGTYQKAPFFRGSTRLNHLTRSLVSLAENYGWQLQAWAVFANHYHFIAASERPFTLTKFVRHLHSISAKYVNHLDQTAGRKVWHQYWDTRISYQRSFLARLHYVHANAVEHGLIANPELYEWCSTAWFARTANHAFRSTVGSFRTDQIAVPDDYEIEPVT
jgi:putative transposase